MLCISCFVDCVHNGQEWAEGQWVYIYTYNDSPKGSTGVKSDVCDCFVLVCCGVVVSCVRRMNEVNARRAWLVPGWVTVFGRIYHFGM